MKLETIIEYCLSKKGATKSFPFSKLPEVLAFKVGNKMFVVTDAKNFEYITLKCRPELINKIKVEYEAVSKPPYFDEKHWISVGLDGSIPSEVVLSWIDNSYVLVLNNLPKKERIKYE